MSNIVYICRPHKKEDNKPLSDHLKGEEDKEVLLGKVRSEGGGIEEGENAGLEMADAKNIAKQASSSMQSEENAGASTIIRVEKVGLYNSHIVHIGL